MLARAAACLSVLALSALGAQALASPPDKPGFDVWGNAVGTNPYSRFKADCEQFEHAFGRNAAWGLWRLPLAELVVDAPADAEGKPTLIFRCRDGSACIQAGAYRDTPKRLSGHPVTFDTADEARAFSALVAGVKSACGIDS